MSQTQHTPSRDAAEELVIHYDLHGLPTAQHKAGVAGLLLMVESMRARYLSPVPKIMNISATGLDLVLTPQSLQTLFDDLFDASFVEVRSNSKWSGKTPKRIEIIESEKGKNKKEKVFIYEVVQPDGRFLSTYYPDGDGIWLKLWRDMLWSIMRGRPTTRGVFNERAEGKSSAEAVRVWKSLNKTRSERSKDKTYTERIASSLFIGAQDENAEKVPFQGEPENNFLLYFWPLVALVYAPRRLSIKGDTSRTEYENAGYVLVIPEPTNLTEFTGEATELFRSLDPMVSGYRPRDALIDVPAEGGMEYLYHLTKRRLDQTDLDFCLAAVEIYHLEKKGNNIKTLAAERILPNPSALRLYDALRHQCRNPIYKSRRIQNLLEGRRWHEGMLPAFGRYPWGFFIGHRDKTPRRIPFFGRDVRETFNAISEDLKQGGATMTDDARDDLLAQRVHRLIGTYVNRKTESRSGITYDQFKDRKDEQGRLKYPDNYLKAREKVCSDAFLAMRGRRDADFVEYFTGTICSVPQWLPQDDYLVISQALLTDWEKVKTLSMLALSACSYSPKSATVAQEGDNA